MADYRNRPLEQWSSDPDTVRLLRLGNELERAIKRRSS